MRYCLLVALAGLTMLTGCQVDRRVQDESAALDYYVEGQLLIDADGESDEDAALEALLKAVEADPQLSIAHAAIGDIFRKRGENEMAVHSYELAVAANAWNFRNHYNCGSLHQLLADTKIAAEAITRHLKRAVELFARAVQLDDTDYDAHLNLGVCRYRLGDMEQATAHYRDAIKLDDTLPHAYANMGAVYDRLGKNAEAITMYKQSLERDPQQPQVLMNLGAVFIRQQKWRSAIRSYQQALELEPDSAEALHWIGHCHFFLKEIDKSIEYYKAALAVDSVMAKSHRGLGIAYMSMFLKDQTQTLLRDKAIDHWRKSLEIDPSQTDLAKWVQRYAG